MDQMRSVSDHYGPASSYDPPGYEGRGLDAGDAPGDAAPPPLIGQDERRMHVRAYNFWAKLLGNRSFPAIEDLDLDAMGDFGTHAVLLDFTSGIENPAIVHVGDAIRAESGLDADVGHIADVPRRTLLSRLTDHYLQIIANRAPIGFEAEFANDSGATILYRGVLLPFSSDDDTIDFILGVINWKQAADSALTDALSREVEAAARAAPQPRATAPIWADGPDSGDDVATDSGGDFGADAVDDDGVADVTMAPFADFTFDDQGDSLTDGPTGRHGDDELKPVDAPADDASLADLLAAARGNADVASQADVRGHRALYRAIASAWAFARAADADPENYAELLDGAGLKAQPRAPLTPLVKLVFGVSYDKSRLAEYTAVLRHAERERLSPVELEQRLAVTPGGIKALVKTERAMLRPNATRADRSERAMVILRGAPVLAHVDVEIMDEEFVILVARREADGRTAIVAASDVATTARLLPQFLARG